MNEDIDAMLNALESLERVDISIRPGLYRQIHKSIQNYLQYYCNHHIVTDMIDTDPERSETIRYCEYCRQTYD